MLALKELLQRSVCTNCTEDWFLLLSLESAWGISTSAPRTPRQHCDCRPEEASIPGRTTEGTAHPHPAPLSFHSVTQLCGRRAHVSFSMWRMGCLYEQGGWKPLTCVPLPPNTGCHQDYGAWDSTRETWRCMTGTHRLQGAGIPINEPCSET